MTLYSVSAFARRPRLRTLKRHSSIPQAILAATLNRTASKAEIRIGGYNPAKIKSGSSISRNPIDTSRAFEPDGDQDPTALQAAD